MTSVLVTIWSCPGLQRQSQRWAETVWGTWQWDWLFLVPLPSAFVFRGCAVNSRLPFLVTVHLLVLSGLNFCLLTLTTFGWCRPLNNARADYSVWHTVAGKSIWKYNMVEKGCRLVKCDLTFEMAHWPPDSQEMFLCCWVVSFCLFRCRSRTRKLTFPKCPRNVAPKQISSISQVEILPFLHDLSVDIAHHLNIVLDCDSNSLRGLLHSGSISRSTV